MARILKELLTMASNLCNVEAFCEFSYFRLLLRSKLSNIYAGITLLTISITIVSVGCYQMQNPPPKGSSDVLLIEDVGYFEWVAPENLDRIREIIKEVNSRATAACGCEGHSGGLALRLLWGDSKKFKNELAKRRKDLEEYGELTIIGEHPKDL